jgi:hypothetical protein
LPSPMFSRIAAQKDAEHASQAALESVARLKASWAAGFALGPKGQGILVCPATPLQQEC